jgi:hypothetical protein
MISPAADLGQKVLCCSTPNRVRFGLKHSFNTQRIFISMIAEYKGMPTIWNKKRSF